MRQSHEFFLMLRPRSALRRLGQLDDPLAVRRFLLGEEDQRHQNQFHHRHTIKVLNFLYPPFLRRITGAPMITILLLALLQAPDELPTFLATLEKDRAKGATNEVLLKKIDEWSQGKPEDVLARIAWNRALIESTIRINALFVEGLKKRIGKQVTVGRSTGLLKEVKADRVVIAVPGGTMEVEFAAVPFDARLDDIKKEGLLPATSAEEAVFRFAGGKSVPAMSTALALAGDDRDRALAAIAGWVLQETDKAFAAGFSTKAAEDFAATWAKQADLMNAAGGALRKFVDTVLAPNLVEQADAVLEKDRKEARKLLDLAASLCRADDIVAKVSERRWNVLDKNEWMRIPLESLNTRGGTLEGTKMVWEDTEMGGDKGESIEVKSLTVSWEETSGIRARIKPGTAKYVAMRVGLDSPSAYHSVNFQAAEPMVFHTLYADRGAEGKNSGGKKIGKKADYDFRAEHNGKRWRFTVDAVEVYTGEGSDPSILFFVVGDGKAELLSLEVRKK